MAVLFETMTLEELVKELQTEVHVRGNMYSVFPRMYYWNVYLAHVTSDDRNHNINMAGSGVTLEEALQDLAKTIQGRVVYRVPDIYQPTIRKYKVPDSLTA